MFGTCARPWSYCSIYTATKGARHARHNPELIVHAYLVYDRAVVHAMTGFASLGFSSSLSVRELTLDRSE